MLAPVLVRGRLLEVSLGAVPDCAVEWGHLDDDVWSFTCVLCDRSFLGEVVVWDSSLRENPSSCCRQCDEELGLSTRPSIKESHCSRDCFETIESVLLIVRHAVPGPLHCVTERALQLPSKAQTMITMSTSSRSGVKPARDLCGSFQRSWVVLTCQRRQMNQTEADEYDKKRRVVSDKEGKTLEK